MAFYTRYVFVKKVSMKIGLMVTFRFQSSLTKIKPYHKCLHLRPYRTMNYVLGIEMSSKVEGDNSGKNSSLVRFYVNPPNITTYWTWKTNWILLHAYRPGSVDDYPPFTGSYTPPPPPSKTEFDDRPVADRFSYGSNEPSYPPSQSRAPPQRKNFYGDVIEKWETYLIRITPSEVTNPF